MTIRAFAWSSDNAEKRHAAVLAWLLLARDAPDPGRITVKALDAHAKQLAKPVDPREGVKARAHWLFTHDTSWGDKFLALVAATSGTNLRGQMARKALHHISRGQEIRLVQLGDEPGSDWLATWMGPERLSVFCPRTGCWEMTVGAAQSWFNTHMREHYASHANQVFRAWVVDPPIRLHTTWIGPTQATPVTVPPHGAIHPDVSAIKLLSDQLETAEIYFHCLARHKADFETALAGYPRIRVLSIEEQMPTYGGHDIVMSEPDFSDLEMPVAFMAQNSLALQEDFERRMVEAAAKQGAPAPTAFVKRDLVNIKNIWSFYALWLHGGYHIDTGVFPEAGKMASLQPVHGFGAAARHVGTAPLFQKLALADKRRFNALLSDTDLTLRAKIFIPPRRTRLGRRALVWRGVDGGKMASLEAPVGRNTGNAGHFDIWLLRAPKRDPILRRVLEFYAREWFVLQSVRREGRTVLEAQPSLPGDDPRHFDEAKYRAACRNAIISALYTGMCPGAGPASPDRDAVFNADQHPYFARHVVDFDPATKVVASLNLHKVNFGTHR